MKEQAAITLADIAHDNADMQAVIIDLKGVPPLLACIRMGSQLGQEHAARAIWHLAALTEAQPDLVECGAIPDLVQLLKTGSPKAQEMAAAGISDLAYGGVIERQEERPRREPPGRAERGFSSRRAATRTRRCPRRTRRPQRRRPRGRPPPRARPREGGGGGGGAASPTSKGPPSPTAKGQVGSPRDLGRGRHPALVALLTTGLPAREFASCALRHLALEVSNQSSIAKCNGIAPLVTILDDGTEMAHKHRRTPSRGSRSTTSTTSRRSRSTASRSSATKHRRAAARRLARPHHGEPGLAGRHRQRAPSALVTLTTGAAEVKERPPARSRRSRSTRRRRSSRSRRASSSSSARARRRRRSRSRSSCCASR